MPSELLAYHRTGQVRNGFFFKPKIPQFTSINLTLNFKGSTGNNPVQEKVRSGGKAIILGLIILYKCMHTCMHRYTHRRTGTGTKTQRYTLSECL